MFCVDESKAVVGEVSVMNKLTGHSAKPTQRRIYVFRTLDGFGVLQDENIASSCTGI